MADNSFISEIKLNKVEVSFPAFIPQTVVIIGIPVEAYMEPVLIDTVPFIFQYVLKSPEPPAHMIEYSVDYDLDSGLMKFTNYFPKVIVCSDTAVNDRIISCVVSVCVRFKQR